MEVVEDFFMMKQEELKMNAVNIGGRLANDVELRTTTSGKSVASFRIAVKREYAKEGETQADFFNVVVWNRQAENCGKYLKKGSYVTMKGRLQTRSYEAEDGSRRYITEIVASNVEFVTSPKEKVA